MTEFSSRITTRIAQEISARPNQVEAAVALLDGGATVPFIARYRKDVTGNLSDAQLRILEERLIYLRELDDRRGVILAAIELKKQVSSRSRILFWQTVRLILWRRQKTSLMLKKA